MGFYNYVDVDYMVVAGGGVVVKLYGGGVEQVVYNFLL